MPSPSLLFISVLLLLSGSFARPGSVLLSQPSSESVDKSEREALSHRNQVRDPFALEGLRRHNEKRALHGSPALTLDNRICLGAQAWANELAATDSMRHSGSQFGENLFSLWGEAVSAGLKALNWYYCSFSSSATSHKLPKQWIRGTQRSTTTTLRSQGFIPQQDILRRSFGEDRPRCAWPGQSLTRMFAMWWQTTSRVEMFWENLTSTSLLLPRLAYCHSVIRISIR